MSGEERLQTFAVPVLTTYRSSPLRLMSSDINQWFCSCHKCAMTPVKKEKKKKVDSVA